MFFSARVQCQRMLDAARKRRSAAAIKRDSRRVGGASSARGTSGAAATAAATTAAAPAAAGDADVALEAWLSGEADEFFGVLQELPPASVAGAAGGAAASSDSLGELMRLAFGAGGGGAALMPPQPLPQPLALPPARVTAAVKVHDAAPSELPPGMASDWERWLAPHFAHPSLIGAIQPGCTLLTVDALCVRPRTRRELRRQADALAAAQQLPQGLLNAAGLAECLLSGGDAPFWRSHAFTVRTAAGDAITVAPGAPPRALAAAGEQQHALPPLQQAALLSTRAGVVNSVAPLRADCALRVRVNGQLLACEPAPRGRAGAPLSLPLPATHADGCALVGCEADGAAPARALLLCRDAAIVAEVARLRQVANDPDDANEEAYETLLYTLGAALRPDAPRRVVLPAAAAALRRGWGATAARMLAALRDAPPDDEHFDDADADDDVGDDAHAAAGTLLHAAAWSGQLRMVELVLAAAASAAESDDTDVDADALQALGTPACAAGPARLTPLHIAAAALALEPHSAERLAVAHALVSVSGRAAVAWLCAQAAPPGGACTTPAALAARAPAGAALTAALTAYARRLCEAGRPPPPRAGAPRIDRARVASHRKHLLAAPLPPDVLPAPPPAAAAAAPSASPTPSPSRGAPPMGALARCAAALYSLPLVARARRALGYDDAAERTAFEAHAAAASVPGMVLYMLLVISYHLATELRRIQLPPRTITREHLLANASPHLSEIDQVYVYYGIASNAWLRVPVTACMCVALLPPLRTFYIRHNTALLGAFWVVQFLAAQIIVERQVRAMYDLPAPLVWACSGNKAQLFVCFLGACLPLRAAPLCALLALRAVLPFLAPHGRIWFYMAPCARGWLPAAPANAALTAVCIAAVLWNERRALRSWRAWRAADARRAAAAAKKLE
jgi:hypothetical protein